MHIFEVGFYTVRVNGDIVEFWDGKVMASSYYIKTFMGVQGGLNLNGGVPKWVLIPEEVKEVQEWLCKN